LSQPKYRVFIFLTVLIVLAIIPISILESLPNLSLCSKILGDHCYSQGITRGTSSLLKGDIQGAIRYNPLSLAVLITMLALLFSDIKKCLKNHHL
jgi:hypothetical protein